jgi:hypothetical protein
MLGATGVASAAPVALVGEVTSPPPPIHPTDVILLRATTPDAVFRHSGFAVESTLSFLGEFALGWQIISFGGGSGVPGLYPLVATRQFYNVWGPLPVGIYHVTVEWQDAFGPLIDPAVNSGTGTFSFEVVPEPGSLALLATGCGLLVSLRRRPHRSRQRRARASTGAAYVNQAESKRNCEGERS